MINKVASVKEWYVGLTDEQILKVLSFYGHETVANFIQGDKSESEKMYDAFNMHFEYVIPRIVDAKSFWYGNKNGTFERYEKLHDDILYIKRGMENNLWEAVKKDWK